MDVLFDTNIYGKMAEEGDLGVVLVESLAKDRDFIIHNFKLVRDELRGAPKILPIYDKLVRGKVILENNEIKNLARDFFEEYKRNGGVQGQKKMMNDFKIVACAVLNRFDLIVTEDQKTMLNPLAIKAYRHVSLRKGMRSPTFFRYHELKRKYFS